MKGSKKHGVVWVCSRLYPSRAIEEAGNHVLTIINISRVKRLKHHVVLSKILWPDFYQKPGLGECQGLLGFQAEFANAKDGEIPGWQREMGSILSYLNYLVSEAFAPAVPYCTIGMQPSVFPVGFGTKRWRKRWRKWSDLVIEGLTTDPIARLVSGYPVPKGMLGLLRKDWRVRYYQKIKEAMELMERQKPLLKIVFSRLRVAYKDLPSGKLRESNTLSSILYEPSVLALSSETRETLNAILLDSEEVARRIALEGDPAKIIKVNDTRVIKFSSYDKYVDIIGGDDG